MHVRHRPHATVYLDIADANSFIGGSRSVRLASLMSEAVRYGVGVQTQYGW